MNIETGFFFISDITGYTRFLTQSELGHAKEILDAMFDSIVENVEAPLAVSKVEGDAVFCYVPDRLLRRPESMLDAMEATYGSRSLPDYMTSLSRSRAARLWRSSDAEITCQPTWRTASAGGIRAARQAGTIVSTSTPPNTMASTVKRLDKSMPNPADTSSCK